MEDKLTQAMNWVEKGMKNEHQSFVQFEAFLHQLSKNFIIKNLHYMFSCICSSWYLIQVAFNEYV